MVPVPEERPARKYQEKSKRLLAGWLDLQALDQQRRQLGELLLGEIIRIPALPRILEHLKALPEEEKEIGLIYAALLPKPETSEIFGWQKVNEAPDKLQRILKASKSLKREGRRMGIFQNRRGFVVVISSREPLTRSNLEITKRSLASEIGDNLKKVFDAPLSERFNHIIGTSCCHLSGAAVHEARDVKLHQLVAEAVEKAMEDSIEKKEAKTDRDSFFKTSQPIFDITTSKIVAHEAPLAYLGLAQEADFERGRSVFFNLDPQIIGEPTFREVAARLLESPTTPYQGRSVFEITERAVYNDFDRFQLVFRYFKTLGFGLALDNARSDYASLETIKELKPNFIKIGLSLTSGIHEDEIKQDLLAPLIAFAGKAKVPLIAKEIENQAQLETLKKLGIRFGQGPLLR